MSLSVFALIVQLLKGSEKQSHLSAGTILAEEILTERLERIFANLEPGMTKEDFFALNSPPADPLLGTKVLGNTTYNYRIEHQTLVTGAGSLLGGDPAQRNRLKKIDISVWWWVNDDTQSRSGMGRLKAESSRFINEKTRFDGL